MPVEQSIHWKPLHDSHYVVASLQPAGGGRRRIFVRQQVLAQAEALVRASRGRRRFGLLLGELLLCPVTGANYLVIESVAEQHPLADEGDLARGIREALARIRTEKHAQVIGWYSSVSRVDAKPSAGTMAVHSAYFTEPWQTALVIADGAYATGGAFFLHDTASSRWFYAPFYELPAHAPAAHQPKVTCIAWPQYMTADAVVLTAREPAPAPKPAELPVARPREDRTYAGPTIEPADARRATVPVDVSARERTDRGTPPGTIADDRASVADRPVPREAPQADGAEPLKQRSEMVAVRVADGPVGKLPTVDDRDQRQVAGRADRRVSDAEDTAAGDEPARYIELARAEGFFVAAKFESAVKTGRAETLWVLNEPYSGILLTVVGTGAEVVDANLHFNLHTDDAGLRQTPFPEHRDPESQTIYMRETCVDSLRARCHRLRAANALEREWKVTPKMWLLTPSEWQSATASNTGAGAVSALNDARIAELPEGVRSQFGLTTRDVPEWRVER